MSLEPALAWAARGFRVFPITPGDKVPPRGMSFTTEATTDPAKIAAWWAFEPAYNYGVLCGNGLLVVDVDAHKGGYASLLELDLPEDTLTVRTPGGGLHLYLTGPDVQQSVDRIAPGIDIRSRNGYVVGPGSVFTDPGGKKGYTGAYSVVNHSQPAPAPEPFVLRCGEPKARSQLGPVSVDEPDDIVFALHYLQRDAPASIKGRGGNATAYAVAARVLEIGISVERTVDLMLEHWNDRCPPGWSRGKLLTVVEHAATYMQAQKGSGGVTAAAKDFEGAVAFEPAPVKGKFDTIFAATAITPLEGIPARDWVMHRLLHRGEAAVLAGPGGVGKSGFSLAIAAHGATGQSFAGYAVPRPFKTIVYNMEDSRHEMEARLHAVCATYGFDIGVVSRNVLLWPGREMRFRLMNKDHTFAMADIQEVARLTRRDGFDAMILDPLISLHSEEENSNTAMGDVMEAVNGLARLANVAALALCHTPKGVRQAGSSDSIRGAGNIVNAVRIASTIYAADEADAAVYGLGEGFWTKFVRIDDAKLNNGPMGSKPLWLEKQSFPLPNGDTSYSLRIVETTAVAAGEAKLIATVIASHMERAGTLHLATHDAAKVLTEAETLFRERVPPSGNLSAIKALIELRLAQPVATDSGARVVVQAKTEPGAQTARRMVTLL